MTDLPAIHEDFATKIVNAAFCIHKSIGPGLLERVYEVCMVYELNKAGLKVDRQIIVPIQYDGITFNEGYRIDLLVENSIIIELKSAEQMNALWEAQILSYLKLMNLRLGFVVNFNVPVIRSGIRRYRV